MARKATPKVDGAEGTPQIEELKKETYIGWVTDVATARKKLDEAQTAHASPWKRCDALRIDPKAAKIVEAFARMDPRAAQMTLRNVNLYAGWRGLNAQLDILDTSTSDPAKVAEARAEGAKAAADDLPREAPYQEPTLAANWESGYDEIKAQGTSDGDKPAEAPAPAKRARTKKTGDDAPAPKGGSKVADPDQPIIDQARTAFEAKTPRSGNPYKQDLQPHEHGLWDAEWMVQENKAKWAKTQERQNAESTVTH